MRPIAILALLSLTLPVAAAAQTGAMPMTHGAPMASPTPCAAPGVLPPAFAGFAHPIPAAQGSGMFLGQAAALDLGPGTHFGVPPGHVPADGTFGGMVGFDVTMPGTYQVAVGAAIWVDVVQGGTSVKSTAHGRGPACTAVRKTVDFTLAPGHYTLQLSGSAAPSVTVQVAKIG